VPKTPPCFLEKSVPKTPPCFLEKSVPKTQPCLGESAANLTDSLKITAEFWAGGSNTVSSSLMFIWFWKEYVRIISGVSCSSLIYSLLDLVIHLYEGSRVTAAHTINRFNQEIRDGEESTTSLTSYQDAFFPSEHGNFSKVFALTMGKWFGSNINKSIIKYDDLEAISTLFKTQGSFFLKSLAKTQKSLEKSFISVNTAAYGNFTLLGGEHGNYTLSFSTWNDMADSAGLSQLNGSVHALTAHTITQNIAVQIATYINSSWNISTSNIAPAPIATLFSIIGPLTILSS
jgi:hypothetical protein